MFESSVANNGPAPLLEVRRLSFSYKERECTSCDITGYLVLVEYIVEIPVKLC